MSPIQPKDYSSFNLTQVMKDLEENIKEGYHLEISTITNHGNFKKVKSIVVDKIPYVIVDSSSGIPENISLPEIHTYQFKK